MHLCRSLHVLVSLLCFVPISCASKVNVDQHFTPKALLPPPRPSGLKRNFHKFVTRPDIDAPVWDINVHRLHASSIAPGYWFVAFYGQLDQRQSGELWLGPHIYDGNGDLIWSGAPAFKHWNIFDFGLDHENAGDVLTLLSDHEAKAYIIDNTYTVRREVPLIGPGESKPNMHSFHVIDSGKRALILNIRPWLTSEEVSRQVGFEGRCDARYQGFRELNLQLPGSPAVFEWDAKNHIGLDESTFSKYKGNVTEMCTKGWDILHLNSIDKFPDGDYLLSARHTDALYKISHVDGSIVWRLGGTKSDFKFVGDSKFSRQHHGRVRSQTAGKIVITLFDNAIGDGFEEHPSHDYSRGLVLSLDMNHMTARAVTEYPHPKSARTNARGSFQTLPNGNGFACWAYSSLISEHLPSGEVIMDAKLGVKAHTYRAFKFPWVGRPARPPDVFAEAAVDRGRVTTIVYMSWNGATEVASWQVNEMKDNGSTAVISSLQRTGFETRAKYRGYARRVFVEAFDKRGQSLGKSKVVRTIPPSKIGAESTWARIEEAWPSLPEEPGFYNPHNQPEEYEIPPTADSSVSDSLIVDEASAWNETQTTGEPSPDYLPTSDEAYGTEEIQPPEDTYHQAQTPAVSNLTNPNGTSLLVLGVMIGLFMGVGLTRCCSRQRRIPRIPLWRSNEVKYLQLESDGDEEGRPTVYPKSAYG